jgi:hypothetical protein
MVSTLYWAFKPVVEIYSFGDVVEWKKLEAAGADEWNHNQVKELLEEQATYQYGTLDEDGDRVMIEARMDDPVVWVQHLDWAFRGAYLAASEGVLKDEEGNLASDDDDDED